VGGRFVAEFGGQGNLKEVLAGLHQIFMAHGYDPESIRPWYFPSPEEYRRRLIEQGFEVMVLDFFPRPTRLPNDMTDWLEMFAQPFMAIVPDDMRRRILDEVCDSLRPILKTEDGWIVDYVRLRCRAIKPGVAAASD